MEGATEEEFVSELLASHLRHNGVFPTPRLIDRARRPVRGGGNVSIDRLVQEMRRLSKSFGAVTALVDFCGFRDEGSKLPNDPVEEIRSRISQFDEGSLLSYGKFVGHRGCRRLGQGRSRHMNLDKPNVVLIDLRCFLLPGISRRMLAQVQFHLFEILLPQVKYRQIRFHWSRAMVNNFGYRLFPCLLSRSRILHSKADAFAGTDVGLVCRFGTRGGDLPPTS